MTHVNPITPPATSGGCPFAAMARAATGEAAKPLAIDLKESTAALHSQAEKHPVQARLVGGTANREQYADYLAQMVHLHAPLDATLARVIADPARWPALGTLARPHHKRALNAERDLAALNLPAASTVPSAPSVTRFTGGLNLGDTTGNSPASLRTLGVLYVLEGSTNGGRFIAAAVRKALGLQTGTGDTFLDPHGTSQRERWTEFKTLLDTVTLTSAERAQVIAGAASTFQIMIDLCDELPTHATAGAA